MRRLLKNVLLYLSMLVIPAQGFAASTMLFCGPADQRVKTAQETGHRSGHSHRNTPAADYQDRALPAATVDLTDLASRDEGRDFTNSDHRPAIAAAMDNPECGACAACCVGTSFPATRVKLQPAGIAIERMASTPFRNIGFVTDGPRRPPRFFPA
ncbi:MAG: hypothetical protein IH605_16715 [Burkholderiales bacterium]|nr:hypothetical protein [Burkholderiales bacterium]